MLAGKGSAAPTNRLGGRPNLPRELVWPTRREQPLGFVAQLDLSTLPRIPDLPLPRTGALFFFFELALQPVERMVPSLEDQVHEGLGMTIDERLSYFDFLTSRHEGETGSIHRIGGYPDSVQDDPKLTAQLVSHGLYCGDQTGYKIGKKRGLWPGAKDWELLLQVDSDDRAGMMWGDVGRIYFLIQKAALTERQFEKTWLVFQCS